jgi:hypothetical protein
MHVGSLRATPTACQAQSFLREPKYFRNDLKLFREAHLRVRQIFPQRSSSEQALDADERTRRAEHLSALKAEKQVSVRADTVTGATVMLAAA